MRYTGNTTFKCGHEKTPENTAKMNGYTRCRKCKNEKNLAFMRKVRSPFYALQQAWGVMA